MKVSISCLGIFTHSKFFLRWHFTPSPFSARGLLAVGRKVPRVPATFTVQSNGIKMRCNASPMSPVKSSPLRCGVSRSDLCHKGKKESTRCKDDPFSARRQCLLYIIDTILGRDTTIEKSGI